MTDPGLAAVVRELEAHHARRGWGAPAALYALVATGQIQRTNPDFAAQVGLTEADPDSLTPIEQETMPPGESLEEMLPGIGWSEEVAGCAVVVERLVLPPAAEEGVPENPAAASAYVAEHPDRQEVRIAVAATRDGAAYCALRVRAHDDDASVLLGADLVPELIALVRGTVEEETP